MDIVCVCDNKCFSKKMLVKVAPLGSNTVNVIYYINAFDVINVLDPVKYECWHSKTSF